MPSDFHLPLLEKSPIWKAGVAQVLRNTDIDQILSGNASFGNATFEYENHTRSKSEPHPAVVHHHRKRHHSHRNKQNFIVDPLALDQKLSTLHQTIEIEEAALIESKLEVKEVKKPERRSSVAVSDLKKPEKPKDSKDSKDSKPKPKRRESKVETKPEPKLETHKLKLMNHVSSRVMLGGETNSSVNVQANKAKKFLGFLQPGGDDFTSGLPILEPPSAMTSAEDDDESLMDLSITDERQISNTFLGSELPYDIPTTRFKWKAAIRYALLQRRIPDIDTLVRKKNRESEMRASLGSKMSKHGHIPKPIHIEKPMAIPMIMIVPEIVIDGEPSLQIPVFGDGIQMDEDPIEDTPKLDPIENLINAWHVKAVLNIHPDFRDEPHVETLDQILGTIACFAKLPPSVRYENHETGSILIKQNHKCETMYAVMLGELAQYQTEQGPAAELRKESPMAVIEAGDFIGDFSGTTGLRQYSVAAMTPVELVCVDKKDWFNVMKEVRSSAETYQVDALANLPIFAGLNRSLITQLSNRSIVRRFQPNASMVAAGDVAANLYFISKGHCRVIFNLPFLKMSSEKSTDFNRQFTLIAYTGQRVEKGMEMVHVPSAMTDMAVGDFFPKMGRQNIEGHTIPTKLNPAQETSLVPQRSMTWKSSSNLQKSDKSKSGLLQNVQAYKNMWPPVVAPRSEYSFTAIDQVEVVMVPRKDVIDLVPKEIVHSLMGLEDSKFPTPVRIRELQEKYIATQGWVDDGTVTTTRQLVAEVERERQEYVMVRNSDNVNRIGSLSVSTQAKIVDQHYGMHPSPSVIDQSSKRSKE